MGGKKIVPEATARSTFFKNNVAAKIPMEPGTYITLVVLTATTVVTGLIVGSALLIVFCI
jgi:hypothetical protein